MAALAVVASTGSEKVTAAIETAVSVLANATSGSQFVLDTTNSVPPLVPGSRYYLGVQNLDCTTNVTFGIEVDFGVKPAASPGPNIFEAEIIEHVDLNSSRSDKETVHLALSFEGGAPAYEPGDSLDLYAENDPDYVDELLKAAGLPGDDKLRPELIRSRDVTTLSLKTVETYAEKTGHQYVKTLLADGQAREWIAGRQLIDDRK